jgi:hypothetical protein
MSAVTFYSLKEIISFYSIKFPGLYAALLKTVFQNHMDKDLPCLVSRSTLYFHVRHDTLSSLVIPMGILFAVC